MGVHRRGYIAGGPQLLAQLAKLRRELASEALVKASDAGAQVIADEWRAQVESRIGRGPGTAHYADAIGVKSFPGDRGAVSYIALNAPVSVSRNEAHPSEYASRLEFTGKPTLRPAYDAAQARALDRMADVLRKLIEKAV